MTPEEGAKHLLADYGCKLVNEKVIGIDVDENGVCGLKTTKGSYTFDAEGKMIR